MGKMTKKEILIEVINWLLHYFSYAAIFVLIATTFKSFTIDDSHLYTYGLLATLIIFVLNKTVKPLIFKLTIPITGLTLGLFYPFINVFILKLTDWILGSHFEIEGIWTVFLIAILISVINLIIDYLIIKPIVRRLKKNG
jgi:putative membrane protein